MFKLAIAAASAAAASASVLPDAFLGHAARLAADTTPEALTEAAWESLAALEADVAAMGSAQLVRYARDEALVGAGAAGAAGDYLPVVMMHGMGDHATSMGMRQIKKDISAELDGAYVTSAQLGSSAMQDILNGFLLPLDASVDMFASIVQADESLAGGFNAVGFSQGNLVIRGYVERYNDPPVSTHLSVHGPMMGVAGMPDCSIESSICRALDGVLSELAYNSFMQGFLTQANYFRDPMNLDKYQAKGQGLATWNLESTQFAPNATYAANYASLDQLALVHALNDTVVIPSESEHFGYFQDGSQTDKWTMAEAPWYTDNWFGLQDLDGAGKLAWESTEGDHLQFSTEELNGWVDAYLK